MENSTDAIMWTTPTERGPFMVYEEYWGRQIFAAMCLTVSITGFVGNTLVVTAVSLSKKLRTVTNVFVVSLSISDLLSCSFMPWQAVGVLSEDGWPLPQAYWLCVATIAAMLIGNGCSINTLALIAVRRWIGITKSKALARRIYTHRTVACMLVLSYTLPVCCTILPAAMGFGELGYEPLFGTCSWVKSNPYAHIQNILGVVFYFPLQLIIIAMCYISIFRYVLKTSRRMARHDTQSVSGSVSGADRAMRRRLWKRQIAVTKNLVYIVLAYVFCLLPFFIVLASSPGQAWIYRMAPYAGLTVYVNTCINPILYATTHPDFKEAFSYMIRGKWKDIPQTTSHQMKTNR
ncbi:octopamine receptor Oamb-like [Patiria miniata]|uniref:G-protein coupled receptors family 1 profile domain-containing protein n=1 Tax=Patiria miniata TaxID=46514 RepID=A0A913Z1V2_PATMI|nr:octopamine receptor Oamb-like [Patiria miniata]